MPRHPVTFLAGLLALSLCVSSCGSSKKPEPSSSPSTSTSSTSSPTAPSSSTADPRVRAAIDVYMKYYAASSEAKQSPPKNIGEPLPAAADFTKYSFDPLRLDTLNYVLALGRAHAAWRGTPPEPRLSVRAVNLAAKPYPTVVLANCPTVTSWEAYDLTTGKPLENPTTTSAPPPYESTIEVTLIKGQWGVSSSKPDSSRTCTPS